MSYLKRKKGSLESSILSVWTVQKRQKVKKVDEKLVGGQKKFDKDKDGDIDKKKWIRFAILRKEKGKKKVDELTKGEKITTCFTKEDKQKKKEKNENYEVGTKEDVTHYRNNSRSRSKEDFEKQVEVNA